MNMKVDRQHKCRLRKRKALYPLMEDELVNYITELRSRGIIVHRNTSEEEREGTYAAVLSSRR